MLTRRTVVLGALAGAPVAVNTMAVSQPAHAAQHDVIDARVNLALGQMYATIPRSRELSTRARAMLVMPSVVKGGFILGGAYGEGSLLVNSDAQGYQSAPAGYYSVAAASIGFQVGLQSTSHVLFFMTDTAAEDFRRSNGWEVGVDAEVTFPEKGLNAQTNSTVLSEPVIAVVFGQDGFLVGASLEGAKYSPLIG